MILTRRQRKLKRIRELERLILKDHDMIARRFIILRERIKRLEKIKTQQKKGRKRK